MFLSDCSRDAKEEQSIQYFSWYFCANVERYWKTSWDLPMQVHPHMAARPPFCNSRHNSDIASFLPRNLLQSGNGGEFDTLHSRGPFSLEFAFWSSHVQNHLFKGSDFALPVRRRATDKSIAGQRISLEILKLVHFEFETTFGLTYIFLLDNIENLPFRFPNAREICAGSLCQWLRPFQTI